MTLAALMGTVAQLIGYIEKVSKAFEKCRADKGQNVR